MGIKECRKCHTKKSISEFWINQKWCKKCQSSYHKRMYILNKEKYLTKQNEYRKTERYRELHRKDSRLNIIRNKEKTIARQEVYKALLRGDIKKKPCRECGKIKVQAHHPDHKKPLEIDWLCILHHREADQQAKENIV